MSNYLIIQQNVVSLQSFSENNNEETPFLNHFDSSFVVFVQKLQCPAEDN